MSIKINNENYALYKNVYATLCGHLFKDINKLIASTTSPISVLDELEKSNNSKAKIALQSGLNDSISILKQYSKILIDKIDLDLKTSNLPSTNELIGIVTKTIKKVLSKKFISNLDQYYIIKEVVDSDKSEIKEKDMKYLSSYLIEFEIRQLKKRDT